MLFLAGCHKAPPTDDGMVASLIGAKVGGFVEWSQGGSPSEEASLAVHSLLSQELTADKAIQIALLNNPRVQEIFEEVGIAHADLIEAGLMSNPVYSVEVRFPGCGGLKTNIEYLISASLLDLILIPLRVRLAETEFQQAKLSVSEQILDLAFDVRRCFYELVSERQKINRGLQLVKLGGVVRDLAAAQLAVGNVYSLGILDAEAALLEAEITLDRSQVAAVRLTERLNRLLGLPETLCLQLPESVEDEIVPESFSLCNLQQIAFEERLDLHLARLEIEAICNQLGLSEWWAYTDLQLGLAGERDPDGVNTLGPGFAGEIPIFNYGQADRKRLYARLRQALDHLEYLHIKVSSEVRETFATAQRLGKVVDEYRTRLIPLKGKIIEESAALYNVMGLGIDKLIGSKVGEIMTSLGYVESVKSYLLSKTDLDQALGGKLSLLTAQRDFSAGYCR